MSKCIDCGGGTPAPYWKRCENHAMAILRTLIGGAPVPTVVHRRFRAGDQVIVTKDGQQRAGRVVRSPRGNEYVIELADKQGRLYVNIQHLTTPVPTPEPSSLP